VYGNEGYGDELPHLGYNENTTQVDVILDRLQSNASQSRFAIELVLVADDKLGGDMLISQRDSLDDEHSPGSFHVSSRLATSRLQGNCIGNKCYFCCGVESS